VRITKLSKLSSVSLSDDDEDDVDDVDDVSLSIYSLTIVGVASTKCENISIPNMFNLASLAFLNK
jgi:hypothetical protein